MHAHEWFLLEWLNRFWSRQTRLLQIQRFGAWVHGEVFGLLTTILHGMQLPRFAPGQPVPIVLIPGLSEEVRGVWSLWRIAIASMEWNRRRIMPFFLVDNGMVYMRMASRVWGQLLAANTQVRSILDAAVSQDAFAKPQNAMEEHGKPVYEALVQERWARIAREQEKGDHASSARCKPVARIGLPQVRNYRLSLLAQEERSFQEQLDQKAHAYPGMVPLLVIRVEGRTC
jgi:hypothetical protein